MVEQPGSHVSVRFINTQRYLALLIRHGEVFPPFGLSLPKGQGERTSIFNWPDQ